MKTKQEYQEALDYLYNMAKVIYERTGENYNLSRSKNQKKILQELIDKNTPKKVIGLSINYEGLLGNCPYCNELVFEHQLNSKKITKVCQDCGQAIGWAKNEN